VRITHAFYLGQHEVTVDQFRLFIEGSGYVPESIADGTGGYGYNPRYDPATSLRGDAFEGRDRRYSWHDPGFPQAGDHPVVNITWNDAAAMARWLSEREGVLYRLPSEAEWEYACRAGTSTRYSTGDEPASLLGSAALLDQDTAQRWPRRLPFALPGHDGYAFTAPVGSFAPNAFGLFDMHGNVWEWVADRYGEAYYADSPGTIRLARMLATSCAVRSLGQLGRTVSFVTGTRSRPLHAGGHASGSEEGGRMKWWMHCPHAPFRDSNETPACGCRRRTYFDADSC
jgi:formylglycine-generating enzyme required for sulfatase activity